MKKNILNFFSAALILTFIFSLFLFTIQTKVFSQGCSSLNIQQKADIATTCPLMTMTMAHDILDRPYLYVANKEAGLKIYNVSDLSNPTLVATVATSSFASLDVMNLSQNGNYIYLAIGNHFNSNQNSGFAIIDVTNPETPITKDFWQHTATGGAGIVQVEGNYAYLGAMGNGLMIFDITDKSDIIFLSQIIPDINYPTPNPTASLYNARGMEVKNSIVYLCYDAGGLRIINATNKQNPIETGHFSVKTSNP